MWGGREGWYEAGAARGGKELGHWEREQAGGVRATHVPGGSHVGGCGSKLANRCVCWEVTA